ncbi:hypothetical protein, partial [Pseudomonas coronafaciens]|uniref:hypothetical protein n=1 Tax=Pseudomonas coronafaciens TaxID=53409 RepID=UPI001C7F098A
TPSTRWAFFIVQRNISVACGLKSRGAVNQYGCWLSVNAMLAETKGVLAYRSSPSGEHARRSVDE